MANPQLLEGVDCAAYALRRVEGLGCLSPLNVNEVLQQSQGLQSRHRPVKGTGTAALTDTGTTLALSTRNSSSLYACVNGEGAAGGAGGLERRLVRGRSEGGRHTCSQTGQLT